MMIFHSELLVSQGVFIWLTSAEDRFRTGGHLMAGQVAHWMNLHRDLIATPREDREILSEICQRIKGINDRHSAYPTWLCVLCQQFAIENGNL